MQPDQQPEFNIQRIYTKDISFESPEAPRAFLEPWEPALNLDLQTKATELEAGVREVVLTVTATVKIKEKIIFLVEVQQAGIFLIKNFATEQLGPMLGSFCPNILYPYAREVVTDLVMRGGFPQLYLMPVNFDALYEQQLQSQQGGANGFLQGEEDEEGGGIIH